MEKSFQITDFISDDIIINKVKKFCITLYGKNENNENIACHIVDYLPHFYLKVPDDWDTTDSINLLKRICKNSKRDFSDKVIILKSLIRGDNQKSHVVNGKDFYNLSWDKQTDKVKEFKFFKASFTNFGDMKKVVTEIKKFYNNDPKSKFTYTDKDKDWINLDRVNENDRICDSNLYESSIHPVIRFIHEANIDPTGWVKCTIEDNSLLSSIFGENDIDEFVCNWKNIQKISDVKASNYKIASFDIECDSLTGDFPMPKKNFKKLAGSLFDAYRKIQEKLPYKIEKVIEEDSDSDDDIVEETETIVSITKNILSLSFGQDVPNLKSYYEYVNIQKIKTKDNKWIHPDFVNIISQEISTISNIYSLIQEEKPKSKERDLIVEKIKFFIDENAIDENDNKIVILGDPVIQIGTVFHDYGTNEWYRNILVIGPEDNMKEDLVCDKMDDLDIEVVCCSDEKELLQKWAELIKDLDPVLVIQYLEVIKEMIAFSFVLSIALCKK